MKKICIIAIMIFIILTSYFNVVLADESEENTETVETSTSDQTEQIEENIGEVVEKTDTVTNAYGKIIEVKDSKEVVTGTVTDKVQPVVVEITDGEYIGEEFATDYVLSYDIEGKIIVYELDVGDKVSVQITEDANGNVTASVIDVVRANYIFGLFVLFVIIVVLIGGRKGIKAILGLVLTIILIYFIMIKGIYNGSNAIRNSIITCGLVIVGTFIIIGNGINKKIITAALGTLGGVLTAGIIALIFNNLAKMSGGCEDAVQLSINATTINFNFRHLLFAGILVSALGACMDVGMSIASSLNEIKMKTPDITWQELFKSGMNIGRDVIGTMTNTLILAYVGGSLTLILLFMACNMGIYEILNKETIAEQIIQAISGSMGVVCTVPITSIIYATLNKDKVIYKKVSENRINGKRSLKL